MGLINIKENKINMVLEITKENEVKLLHFSVLPFNENDTLNEEQKSGFRLVEINLSGLDRPLERHGTKYIVTAPGYRMKYDNHNDYRNNLGRKFEITTFDFETGIYVISHFQFYDNISVVGSWSEVTNKGKEIQTLEYISSFNLTGIEKEGILKRDDKMSLIIPHNSWQREMQWETYTLDKPGIAQFQPDIEQRSSKVIAATNTDNWSTKEYLPMGYIENTETSTNLFWQIEHNGSWHWEISDQTGHLYLQLSGPTETESHWFKNLKPGDSFVSVPAAVGVSGGFRIDYAMLSRHSIQSTSDQDDYRRYATIAANSPSGLTPEQSAIWSYPLTKGDKEEVIFNMVNAMLLRIHQSGHLVYLSDERKTLVKEGLDYYKTIRADIKNPLPFWPLGLSKFSDTWVSLGLKTKDKVYLVVWRRSSENNTCLVPIEHFKGKNVSVKCSYPREQNCEYRWNSYGGILSVRLDKQFSARLFEIEMN